MYAHMCVCVCVCFNPSNKETCLELDAQGSGSQFLSLQSHSDFQAQVLPGKGSRLHPGSA